MARIAGIDIPARSGWRSPSRTLRPADGTAVRRPGFAHQGLGAHRRRGRGIRTYVDENVRIEGDLRRDVQQDIKRHRDRVLPGHPPPSRPAGPHSARTPTPHPQGPQAHRRQQEEGCEEVTRWRSQSQPDGDSAAADRKNVTTGVVHIKGSFNNTIVSITDTEGNVIAWASSGERSSSSRSSRKLLGGRRGAVRRPAPGCRAGRPVDQPHGARSARTAPQPKGAGLKGPGSGRDTAVAFDPEHRHRGHLVHPKDVTPVQEKQKARHLRS